jgi:beta-glucosidase-like glycosyl hydrolase
MPEPENTTETTETVTVEDNKPDASSEGVPPRHVPVGELAEERKARKAAEKDLVALRSKVQEFEDRDKTAEQKAAERIAELEKLLADKDTELSRKDQDILRRDIAKDKGVPVNLVTGSTQEEMEIAANAALEWRGGQIEKKPIGALRSGASAASTTDPKQQAAAALRGLNRR